MDYVLVKSKVREIFSSQFFRSFFFFYSAFFLSRQQNESQSSDCLRSGFHDIPKKRSGNIHVHLSTFPQEHTES